ncbi:hypothetical protein K461DRAFT_47994 [Myriangium duriaei CBS 260.36]|uniref:ferric-chelate reductase (NADPH) n=1 Tax=Myriangium duriaei CBS 260.36 TaxID=1168546 RepID=A0A9P4MJ82_9PEZI|nr:hypothetical protein K461DRAFT_47994 [Myriangium duriaei CBS 260.36]
MDMGSMDMNMDPFNEVWLQKIYWTAIGSVVAAFTLANILSRYLAWQRLRSHSLTAAKPKALPALILASFTATVREVSNSTFGRFSVRGRAVFAPTLGKVSMVIANVIVLVILCFYGFDTTDYWSFENIGYRTGRITACQLPVLFLLAGKRNIIGYLSGISYERINWLHRWAARCMLLTATFHMGYWFADWARYDFIAQRVKTDLMTQQGIACWAILAWIVFSSMAPVRGWSYEFFLIQHVVSFAGLVGAIYIHITPTDTTYVWISVGVFFFDRLIRAGYYLYNNLFKVHYHANSPTSHRAFWGNHADFVALPGGYTRVTISNPPSSWSPGQHVFFSCHGLVPLQAHPFTISSIPSDGKMEFIVQSRTGGTKRLLKYAEKLLPDTQIDLRSRKHVAIEGPYGHVRPLQQFDSVVLYAGGTGATFTMPLLRDLVHSWKNENKVVTRRIRFVWVIKSGKQLDWFRDQLSQVLQDVSDLQARGSNVQVKITLYVTCDDTFTLQHNMASTGEKDNSGQPAVGCGAPVVEEITLQDPKSPVVEAIEKKSNNSSKAGNHVNCCCRGDVDEDEDGADAVVCTCNCCGIDEAASSDASSSITDVKKPVKESTRALHPDLNVYSGRPMIKDIMRTCLEQALGESAVVACGPRGLTHDVRLATVSLSDERAVHKGTGAQGIWLHTESFGY